MPQTPHYNASLKAFTRVIRGCTVVGIVFAILGTILFLASLDKGNIADLGFPLLLAYTGEGLIALAILGALLRHAAKTVVDGLGGSVEIASELQSNYVPMTEHELQRAETMDSENPRPVEKITSWYVRLVTRLFMRG